mmetsp:Transcript_41725/g.111248  ORF Transcript_41725/g.111248 Transcript_41725/m.111248 type:complete len:143 (+) Transcript_41725:161-589(+)
MGKRDTVPFVLMVFTCLICTGIMVNVTVVIPTSSELTTDVLYSALIISAWSVGACASLPIFRSMGHKSFRKSYLLDCAVMTAGNFMFWLAASYMDSNIMLLLLSRAFLGLEGGAMYTGNLALVEFSSEVTRVAYLSYYQVCR